MVFPHGFPIDGTQGSIFDRAVSVIGASLGGCQCGLLHSAVTLTLTCSFSDGTQQGMCFLQDRYSDSVWT